MRGSYLLLGELAFLAIGVAGCASVPPSGGLRASEMGGAKSVKPLPPPPVIIQSFASPRLRPGEAWRVYLIASDPKGEMKNFVCIIDQPGVGEYPISITRIFPGASQLNGYVYLVTSAFAHLDFTSLTLTVQIQDAAGQYSKPLEFPLSFNELYTQEPPPPGIFKEHDLGPIMIQVHGLIGEGPSLFFHDLP